MKILLAADEVSGSYKLRLPKAPSVLGQFTYSVFDVYIL